MDALRSGIGHSLLPTTDSDWCACVVFSESMSDKFRLRHRWAGNSICLLLVVGLSFLGTYVAEGKIFKVPVGGAEPGMATVDEKIKLRMKANRLAQEKTEFVVNSKEELEGIMDCTACKRVVLALNRLIVGRISSEHFKNGRERLKGIVAKICEQEAITKTKEILKSCERFVGENTDILLEAYLPRTLVDHELFEELFSVTHFCRTETTFCPPGVKSLDELLGQRIDEQDATEEESVKRKKASKAEETSKYNERRTRTKVDSKQKKNATMKKRAQKTRVRKRPARRSHEQTVNDL